MSKPLLTLCMIVKDEAHGIARTLQSAKPWIDRWCILDTGSTDGTPEIVRGAMRDLGGALFVDAPFVDFATTRNDLLAKATSFGELAHQTEFLLLLDADDVLEGGEALRAFLQASPDRVGVAPPGCSCLGGPCDGTGCRYDPAAWDAWEAREASEEAFYVRMSEGSCEWSSARVVRASAVGPDAWHYVGAVHEVLAHPSGRVPSITIPGVSIRHERGAVSAERMRQRWERDIVLLRAAVEKDPNDTRATFYLARTLRQMGQADEASEWFGRRIALDGWLAEVFESHLEMARIWAGDARIVPLALLRAHAIEPRRAEPLCALAEHFRTQDEHGPAFTFAARAAALPYPREGLFIDGDVYRWKAAALVSISAWYVGEFEAGEAATRKALANDPPEPWRNALVENLRMYAERRRADWANVACMYEERKAAR